MNRITFYDGRNEIAAYTHAFDDAAALDATLRIELENLCAQNFFQPGAELRIVVSHDDNDGDNYAAD